MRKTETASRRPPYFYGNVWFQEDRKRPYDRDEVETRQLTYRPVMSAYLNSWSRAAIPPSAPLLPLAEGQKFEALPSRCVIPWSWRGDRCDRPCDGLLMSGADQIAPAPKIQSPGDGDDRLAFPRTGTGRLLIPVRSGPRQVFVLSSGSLPSPFLSLLCLITFPFIPPDSLAAATRRGPRTL